MNIIITHFRAPHTRPSNLLICFKIGRLNTLFKVLEKTLNMDVNTTSKVEKATVFIRFIKTGEIDFIMSSAILFEEDWAADIRYSCVTP